MSNYSSRQAAAELGVSLVVLQRHIRNKKIPVPPLIAVGGGKLRIWTDEDIEKVKQILPSIKNGRKTRFQKLREKQGKSPKAGAQKSSKTKKKK